MLELAIKAPKAEMEEAWEGLFDFGDTLSESCEKWGEDVVFNLARRMCKTDIQNAGRAAVNSLVGEDGSLPDDAAINDCLTKLVDSYRPGVKREAVPKQLSQADVLKAVEQMPAEQLAALLEAIQQKAQSA